MAGSYNHVVHEETGALRYPENLCSMLECVSGDVYEAVEEMYGMIWYLAHCLNDLFPMEPAALVEEARQSYKEGLALSPTPRFPS